MTLSASPLLVLDKDLRVVAASRSFYLTFRVSRQDTQGRMLYALGNGQWDIPALRELLEKIVPEHGELDGYEVRHAFPEIGERVMLLNARKVFYEGNNQTTMLLAFEDITERRADEREMQLLLEQKDLLLQEMQHRIANSLQIIASILLLKAKRASTCRMPTSASCQSPPCNSTFAPQGMASRSRSLPICRSCARHWHSR